MRLVNSLKNSIKLRVNLDDASAGQNRRRLIQKAVMDELVSMLSPETQPYQMKKGKPNVIMFVGLQGAGKTTTIAK